QWNWYDNPAAAAAAAAAAASAASAASRGVSCRSPFEELVPGGPEPEPPGPPALPAGPVGQNGYSSDGYRPDARTGAHRPVGDGRGYDAGYGNGSADGRNGWNGLPADWPGAPMNRSAPGGPATGPAAGGPGEARRPAGPRGGGVRRLAGGRPPEPAGPRNGRPGPYGAPGDPRGMGTGTH